MILLQIITNYYESIRILAKKFILMTNVLLKSIIIYKQYMLKGERSYRGHKTF